MDVFLLVLKVVITWFVAGIMVAALHHAMKMSIYRTQSSVELRRWKLRLKNQIDVRESVITTWFNVSENHANNGSLTEFARVSSRIHELQSEQADDGRKIMNIVTELNRRAKKQSLQITANPSRG